VTWEPGAPAAARDALARNLESMAGWLGLRLGSLASLDAAAG